MFGLGKAPTRDSLTEKGAPRKDAFILYIEEFQVSARLSESAVRC